MNEATGMFKRLVETPGDFVTLAVLADYMDDEGKEPRIAYAARWMVYQKKWPFVLAKNKSPRYVWTTEAVMDAARWPTLPHSDRQRFCGLFFGKPGRGDYPGSDQLESIRYCALPPLVFRAYRELTASVVRHTISQRNSYVTLVYDLADALDRVRREIAIDNKT